MSDMHLPQADGEDSDLEREERRDVANEIAGRLRNRGIHLTGRETDEELVRVLDAVERFEATVARRGGDLMVDEPVSGDRPIQPDDRRFVLPRRHERESIHAFIDRIAEATERASRR